MKFREQAAKVRISASNVLKLCFRIHNLFNKSRPNFSLAAESSKFRRAIDNFHKDRK